MNLAEPAPTVETVEVEPAHHELNRDTSSFVAEPAENLEEATAEPAAAVEPAETIDDPRKYAPKNAIRYENEAFIGLLTKILFFKQVFLCIVVSQISNLPTRPHPTPPDT